ncbi:unnamed protein product [Laminaria digitata]
MPSRHLDVNVHPTKREVHFLHEDSLLESLHEAVKEKLCGANQSRTFYSQVILPDMNFGSPPEAAPAAQAPPRKPGDSSGASPDTEDVSPPDSTGAGSPSYVLPLTPRNVGLEAMAEEDNQEEEGEGGEGGAGSSHPQLDEAGGGGGKGGGRKRRRVVVAATAALDLGSFAAGGTSSGGGGGSSSSSISGRGGASSGGRGYPDPSPPLKKKQQAVSAPQKLVRTDRTAGSLDAFLQPSRPNFSAASGGGFGGLGGSRSSGSSGGSGGRGKVTYSRGRARGSSAERKGKGRAGVDGGQDGEEEEEGGQGGGEGRRQGKTAAVAGPSFEGEDPVVTEVSSGEDEDEEAIMCVCPEDQEGEGEEEEDEQDEEENAEGKKDEGMPDAAKPISTEANAGEEEEEEQGRSEQPSLGSDTRKLPKQTGAGEGKRAKKRGTKKKKPSKPFAGMGKAMSCDCCGGRRPRGPGGSIVLTDAAAVNPGDVGEGTPPSPGTPSGAATAAMRAQQHKRPPTFVDTDCRYHSVRSLIGDFKTQAHKGLTQMLKKYTFVGMVDLHLSLVQFNTKLVLVNHTELRREIPFTKEAFFQMTLRRFGVMPRLPLATPLPVLPLIRAALDLPEARWAQADGDKDDLTQDAVALLEEKSTMLDEYFMMKLSRGRESDGNGESDQPDDDGDGNGGGGGDDGKKGKRKRGEEGGELCLSSLPLLLEGHSPVPEGLPMFLLRLATEVDWTEERTCFEGVAAELALFYSTLPLDQGEEETDTPAATPTTPRSRFAAQEASPRAPGTTPVSRKGKASRQSPAAGAGAGATGTGREDAGLASAAATSVVQHVLYPAFRWALMPPKTFAADGTVMQLACLERLYKVFERC